jgi:uncharacterized cupredoxin-like copper-binding protein
MTTSFQRHHVAMLLKYSGISFISGAVNHGFFSGERSLWTAAAGIVLFVCGATLEHRLAGEEQDAGLVQTLLWGSLLSVGLGFFTGGLQHFPDSPARSAWVVPLGFVLSVLAFLASQSRRWTRGIAAYGVAGAAVVAAASVGAWQWLEGKVRTVEVAMDDAMRYTPSEITAQAGETLRIVARNTGKMDHELVVGSDDAIHEHAQAMKHGAGHAHGSSAVTVKPGQTGELVVKVSEPGTLQFACLVPGHYEAGMRGVLNVAAARPPAHTGHTH